MIVEEYESGCRQSFHILIISNLLATLLTVCLLVITDSSDKLDTHQHVLWKYVYGVEFILPGVMDFSCSDSWMRDNMMRSISLAVTHWFHIRSEGPLKIQ